jgi:Flp pilus assembly protein TadG
MRFFRFLHIQALTRRFLRERSASILPLFGLMVIFLVVISGAAFDVSRTVNAREKLSFALDAAALSLATELSTSVMTEAQIEQALADSFRANLAGTEFLEEAIENLDFVVNSENGTVTVTSSASLKNYFIDLGGYLQENLGPEAFSFGTSAQVSFSQFYVELALVVDVTGSMGGDMTTLRSASTSVVNILLPEDTDPEDTKVRISLVPYSQGVNLGSYASKVKGGEFYSVSGNCVTERENYGSHEVQFTDAAYNYYTDATPPPLDTFFGGGSTSCSWSSQMVPLTNERDTLLPAITALSAQGGTAGQTGIQWGWNSLSPNYANVWPTDSAPAAYSDDETLKFAIIMTDGDNNRYYGLDEPQYGWYWDNGWKYGWHTCDGWCELSEGESYSNVSSTRSRDLCDAMKDTGIEVFGVYFGNNNNSAGARNMQSCASDGNYYQATSASALISAFSNIAKKIQSIYLSM